MSDFITSQDNFNEDYPLNSKLNNPSPFQPSTPTVIPSDYNNFNSQATTIFQSEKPDLSQKSFDLNFNQTFYKQPESSTVSASNQGDFVESDSLPEKSSVGVNSSEIFNRENSSILDLSSSQRRINFQKESPQTNGVTAGNDNASGLAVSLPPQRLENSSSNFTTKKESVVHSNDFRTKPILNKIYLRALFNFLAILIIVMLVGGVGSSAGYFLAKNNFEKDIKQERIVKEISETKVVEEKNITVETVKSTKPSVVSIIITKELSNLKYGQLFGQNGATTQKQQVGAGSGFIVSEEGYILTNRHVVEDNTADYTVILDDQTQLKATVLDKDPVLDLAVIKVVANRKLPKLTFGDSNSIQVGQTAIAIGNSLGEFNNSVSKGIISGLGRTITATDENGGSGEILEDIIQTDASINAGNSGGPLLDLEGNVLGVNVARASSGENIGFAVPINSAKNILESVIKNGKIIRPYLGINYIAITSDFAKTNNLKYDYGVLITSQNTPAVVPNSPSAKAGIRLNDIILDINGEKINEKNKLQSLLQKNKVDDTVTLKVLRGDQEIDIKVKLEAYPS